MKIKVEIIVFPLPKDVKRCGDLGNPINFATCWGYLKKRLAI